MVSFAQIHDLGSHAIETYAAVALFTEDQRLTVLQFQHVVRLGIAVGRVLEGAIVEDVAVLIDLNKGRASVFGRALECSTEVFDVDVNGSSDKGSFGADRNAERMQGIVHRAHGCTLTHLAQGRGG